jgi:endonuclease-3 related protein
LIAKESSTIATIYRLLYNRFGPRHWWPAETPFEVIVGAILTQNVAWRNVEKAITNLKERGVLSAPAILTLPEEELQLLIRPTRYYKVKARKLRTFCTYLQENYGGSLERLFAQPVEILRPELLQVWGLGKETVDSILCYAGGKAVMPMDSYTERILTRVGLVKPNTSYDKLQELFYRNLPADHELFNEYHAQLDALGHHICLSRDPLCGDCPLAIICAYALTRAQREPEETSAAD